MSLLLKKRIEVPSLEMCRIYEAGWVNRNDI